MVDPSPSPFGSGDDDPTITTTTTSTQRPSSAMRASVTMAPPSTRYAVKSSPKSSSTANAAAPPPPPSAVSVIFFPTPPLTPPPSHRQAPQEPEAQESTVGTSAVTEITSNAVNAKKKFAHLCNSKRCGGSGGGGVPSAAVSDVIEEDEVVSARCTTTTTPLEELQDNDDGDDEHTTTTTNMIQKKRAYAHSVLCPICTAPLMQNDCLAETLDPEETASIIINQSQSFSLLSGNTSTSIVSFAAGDNHKLPTDHPQSACAFLLPLNVIRDGLCHPEDSNSSSSKEMRLVHLSPKGQQEAKEQSNQELTTTTTTTTTAINTNTNDKLATTTIDSHVPPPHCGNGKTFVVSEVMGDETKRDQIQLNLSSWLVSSSAVTCDGSEENALGEQGIEVQVVEDKSSCVNNGVEEGPAVVILGDQQQAEAEREVPESDKAESAEAESDEPTEVASNEENDASHPPDPSPTETHIKPDAPADYLMSDSADSLRSLDFEGANTHYEEGTGSPSPKGKHDNPHDEVRPPLAELSYETINEDVQVPEVPEPDIVASQAIYQRLIDGWLLTKATCPGCQSRLMQSPEGNTECAFCNEKEYTARSQGRLPHTPAVLPLDVQLNAPTPSILILSPVSGPSGTESVADRVYAQSVASSQRSNEEKHMLSPNRHASLLAKLWYLPIPKDLDISDVKAVLEYVTESERNKALGLTAKAMDTSPNSEHSHSMAKPMSVHQPEAALMSPTTRGIASTPVTENRSTLRTYLDKSLSPYDKNEYRDDASGNSYSEYKSPKHSTNESTEDNLMAFSEWEQRNRSVSMGTDETSEAMLSSSEGKDDIAFKSGHALTPDETSRVKAPIPSPANKPRKHESQETLDDFCPDLETPLADRSATGDFSMDAGSQHCVACSHGLRKDEIIDEELCPNPQCELFKIPMQVVSLFEKETRSDISSYVPSNDELGQFQDTKFMEEFFAMDLDDVKTPAYVVSRQLLERQLLQVNKPSQERREGADGDKEAGLLVDDDDTKENVYGASQSSEVNLTDDTEMKALSEKLQSAANALKSLEESVLDTEGSTTSSRWYSRVPSLQSVEDSMLETEVSTTKNHGP